MRVKIIKGTIDQIEKTANKLLKENEMIDRIMNVRIVIDKHTVDLIDRNEIMKYVKRSISQEIAKGIENLIDVDDLVEIESEYDQNTNTVSNTLRIVVLPVSEYKNLKEIEKMFWSYKAWSD